MKILNYGITLFLIMLLSCKTSKPIATQEQINTLDSLIQSKQFIIKSNWAYPLATGAMQRVANSGLIQAGSTATSISLIGNSNFLKISGDSITSYLPYFGERQMQVAYGGGDSAIEFNGVMENYKVTKNKDSSYTITLRSKSNSESFDTFIEVKPNLTSQMTLNGTSRFSIRYSGNVEVTE